MSRSHIRSRLAMFVNRPGFCARTVAWLAVAAAAAAHAADLAEPAAEKPEPEIVLHDAPAIAFPGSKPRPPWGELEWVKKAGRLTDCNSPAHWNGDTLYVFNSWEHPARIEGKSLKTLGEPRAVTIDNDATFNGGRWLEATWKDPRSGVLHGWYHQEADHVQGRGELGERYPTTCAVGAIRSEDDGLTWRDQGFVITPPPHAITTADATKNKYYVGGIGDFGACPDRDERFIYFFCVSFHARRDRQGLVAYRLPVEDCDRPVGKVQGWGPDGWTAPGLAGEPVPFLPVTTDWHGAEPREFWGPVVHWNTHLGTYVMFLIRNDSADWHVDGYYVSFNDDLADPAGWSPPRKILDGEQGRAVKGSGWYVTAIGTGPKETDKRIGERARLFVTGHSRWEIEFRRPR